VLDIIGGAVDAARRVEFIKPPESAIHMSDGVAVRAGKLFG